MDSSQTKFLVWTRALEDWPTDEQVLGLYEVSGVHIPCVQFMSLQVNEKEILKKLHIFKDPLLWVFTNVRSINLLMEYPELWELCLNSTAICFGKATRNKLEEIGFGAIEYEPHIHTAKELGVLLADKMHRYHMVLPGPYERAFDLGSFITSKGLAATTINLYSTVARAFHPEGRDFSNVEKDKMTMNLRGVICFFSPSAVAGFVRIFEPLNNFLHQYLVAVVVGPTTEVAAKKHFLHVVQAQEASVKNVIEESLKVLEKYQLFSA